MDHQDPQDPVRFYDEVADTYADELPSTEPEMPVDLALIDHFLSLLPRGARLLDAGCGAGRMLPVLAGDGRAVEGIDLSSGMIRRARADHPDFPVRIGDLLALPHPDASLDGVFSWYSTVHADDRAFAVIVEGFRRVLRPGGHALLAFQTGSGPRTVGHGFHPFGHDVTVTRFHRAPEDVLRVLADVGLVAVARLERGASPEEKDGQAVVIVRADGGDGRGWGRAELTSVAAPSPRPAPPRPRDRAASPPSGPAGTPPRPRR